MGLMDCQLHPCQLDDKTEHQTISGTGIPTAMLFSASINVNDINYFVQ